MTARFGWRGKAAVVAVLSVLASGVSTVAFAQSPAPDSTPEASGTPSSSAPAVPSEVTKPAGPTVTAASADSRPGQAESAESADHAAPPAISLSDSSALDVKGARGLAQSSGHRVLVRDLTTETSSTYMNPDGTRTTSMSSGPIHVKGADGSWQDIDTTILARAGRLRPAVTSGSVTLSPGGDRALVRQATVPGDVIGFDWPRDLPKPKIVGSTATYPDAGDGYDLVVHVTPSGFELSMVLSKRLATAPVIELPVIAPAGWSTEPTASGGVEFRDSAGTLQATVGATTMADATLDVHTDRPLHHSDVAATLRAEDSGAKTLVLSPSQSFLDDPTTVYPVTIDPATSGQVSDTFDTDIDSAFQTQSYPNILELESGHYTDGGTAGTKRSFLGFNAQALHGNDVTTATFYLFDDHQWNCASEPVKITESSPANSSTNWINQPNGATPTVTFNTAAGDTCTGGRAYVHTSILAIAQDWSNKSNSTDWIRLMAPDETDVNQYHEFYSRDQTSGHPRVDVTYNTVPDAPATATAAIPANTSQQLKATWTPPADDGGSAITGYKVELHYSAGGVLAGTATVSASTRSYTATGLDPTVGYYFKIYAINAVGTGPFAMTNVVVPPSTPTDLNAQPCDQNQTTVTWTATGSGISSYTLNRYDQNAVAGGTIQATYHPSGTTQTVTGLTPGAGYKFTVAATNQYGTGAPTGFSNIIGCGTPDAPTSVAATASNASATVTWAAPDNNASVPVSTYSVVVTDTTTGTPANPATVNAPTTTYTATGLTNGHTYTFTVTATSNGVDSPPATSNQVTPADAPGAPTNVSATEDTGIAHPGTTSATVSWTPAGENGSAVDSFVVQTLDSSGTPTGQTTTVNCRTCTSVDVRGLAYNTTYKFRVAAHNGANVSENSDTTLSGNGWSPWSTASAPLTTGGPVGVTKTLSPLAAGSPATYDAGQAVTYTITIANPSTNPPVTVGSITDALPVGADGSPALFIGVTPLVDVLTTVAGNNVTTACQGCGLSDGQLTITPGTTFASGETRSYVVTGTLTGVPTGAATGESARLCQTLRNAAVVADDYASATTANAPLATVCNADLGVEAWWSYITRTVGVGSTAAVNVANGNLVVSSTDSTPVQGHGRLAFALRRTYNSQENTATSLPGSFGRGWQLNVGATDDLAGAGVTGTGIEVPSVQSLADAVTDPLAVTMIDRDGTRLRFTPHAVLVKPIDVTGLTASVSPLAAHFALPSVPQGQPAFTNMCVDTVYSPPAGVHLSLWRYVAVRANSGATGDLCTLDNRDTSRTPVVVGFAAERPDRLRTEYQLQLGTDFTPSLARGGLTDMTDAAGNDLHYSYNTLGQLTDITEADCSGCRATHIAYSYDSSPATILNTSQAVITDPAGRTTSYAFTNANGQHLLTTVTNDTDGSAVSYTYQGQTLGSGTVTCGGASGQLCTITDERNAVTTVGYNGNAAGDPALGLPRVTALTDRLGHHTTLSYSDADSQPGSSVTVTEMANGNGADAADTDRQQIYGPIDSDGRVWQTLEGPAGLTTSNALHTTQTVWDGENPNGRPNVYCRSDVTDHTQDNNRCELTRLPTNGPTGTPTEDTQDVYDDAGMIQREQRSAAGSSPAQLVTTYGYTREYAVFDPSNLKYSYRTSTEAVLNGGNVAVAEPPAPTDAIFTLADRTAMVRPTGNAGATITGYTTTYTVDNATAQSDAGQTPIEPNTTLGSPCESGSQPGTATSNTGLLCAVHQPYDAGLAQPGDAVTAYGYDSHGQRIIQRSPNAADTTYSYYPDAARDLSGQTSAGGWLATVTDATGHFIATGYDAAGNAEFTWDRTATAGHNPSEYPGSLASGASNPPPAGYAAVLRGLTATTSAADAAAHPWRWVSSRADQLGNTTRYTVDAAGNVLTATDPLGGATTSTYDLDNNLTSVLTPANSTLAGAPVTSYTYDAFDERKTVTDPNQALAIAANTSPAGASTRYFYDAVGRLTETDRVRSDSNGATPTGCYANTTVPALPTNAVFCRTTQEFDPLDNVVKSTDASGADTLFVYDAAHRRTDVTTPSPGSDTANGGARTTTVYDADGNVLTTCKPRFYTEGAGSCSTSATGYVVQHSYDAADRQLTTTTYQSTSAGSAQVTSMSYDADGNVTSVVDPIGNSDASLKAQHTRTNLYDALDRVVETDQPRDTTTTLSTYTLYDPSGDKIATIAPGASSDNTNTATRVTGASFDADHRVIDTVSGLQVSFDLTAPLYDPTQITHLTSALAANTATGTANTRYRTVYDANGNSIARYEPRAFTDSVPAPTATGGFSSPYMVRTDYDADNRPIEQYIPRTSNTVTDPNAASLAAGSAEANQCTSTGPATAGLPTYPADVHTCRTSAIYDANGNMTTVVLPTATTEGTGRTSDNRRLDYTYSADNLLQSVSSPDPAAATGATGRRTVAAYTFDGAGRTLTSSDGLGLTTTTAYFPAGTRKQVTAPPGSSSLTHVTKYDYDADANPTSVKTPRTVGGTTEDDATITAYTADDKIASQTAPGATISDTDVTSYAYDLNGNTQSITSPSANAGDATNPAHAPTVNTYTADNLLATTLTPATETSNAVSTYRRTSYGYDPAGRKTSVTTDKVGPAVNGSYPVLTAGDAQTFDYAANDRLLTQHGRADSTAETISTTYDASGNPTCVLDQQGSGATCSNPTGANAVSTGYYLDGTTRTVTQTPDGQSAKTTSYSYDGAGTVIARGQDTVTSGAKVTAYTANDAGLITSMNAPLQGSNATTTWTYDGDGQPTRQTDPNSTVRSWIHDPGDDTLSGIGLSSSVSNANSSNFDLAHYAYSFDEAYRLLSDTHSGTTAGGSGNLATTTFAYTYQPSGRLASFTNGTASTQAISWDHDGNRTGFGSATYTYNPDNSLATSQATSTSATHADNYDVYGRLASDGCTTDSYDGFDRTASTTVGASADSSCRQGVTATSVTTTYGYDGLDRQNTSSTTAGTATTVATVYYDGTSQTTAGEARSGAGSTNIDYALTASGQPESVTTGTSSAQQYLIADRANNIVDATDNGGGSGAIACAMRYDPFGATTPDNSTASAPATCITGSTITDVLFQSSRQDATSGNYQFGSRTYDPSKSAFTTPDSYRSAGSAADLGVSIDPLVANTYAYVNGDPVNLSDPTGHEPHPTPGTGNFYGGTAGTDYYGVGCGRGYTACTVTAGASRLADQIEDRRLANQAAATTPPKAYQALRALDREKESDPDQYWDAVSRNCQGITPLAYSPPPGIVCEDYLRWSITNDVLHPQSAADKAKEALEAIGYAGVLAFGGGLPGRLASDDTVSVFYSGLEGGEEAAAGWAARNGGTTLEMSLDRRGISMPKFDDADPASVAAWEKASADAAQSASGDVIVLQGAMVRRESVWARIEFNALRKNPDVTSVTWMNPDTGEWGLLWSRK